MLIGSFVQVRGEPWRVVNVNSYAGCSVVQLEGCGPGNAGVRQRLVAPFDRMVPVVQRSPVRRRRHAVLRCAAAAIAGQRPAGGLWTAASARLMLVPYQLEPALAVLGGATRVLLGDAVGLGKTIQAGLIVSELRERGLAERVLVLTPPGLRRPWAHELRQRFGIESTVLDIGAVAQAAATLPVGANPWSTNGVVIASLDFAKRAEVLAAIEDAPWDLVIADEAHHLTPGSDRGHAVACLAWRVPWLVLVSATPHSGEPAAFAYLTGLGALGDPLVVFRRTRREVSLAAGRRECLLAVTPSIAESAMLEAAHRYARAVFQGRGVIDRGALLVSTTLARRAASSAAALGRTVTRRLALLSGEAGLTATQPALPWEDEDTHDDDADQPWLAVRGLDDGEVERGMLEQLAQLAGEAARHASKIRRLRRLLARCREPMVVFSEYRDTIDAIAPALATTHRVAILHGGVPLPARVAAIERFTEGDAQVLLATDAAGEGLNLHQRCRLVVNLELPWNPQRLEQRVGRVDRIGQRRRVHAVHLYHRGTIEDTVLARLERRRARAGADLAAGESWVTEDAVARCALGGEPLAAGAAPRISSHRVAAAVEEASRLERARALAGHPFEGCPIAWSPPGAAGGPSRVALLHEAVHVDPHQRMLARTSVAVLIDLPHRLPHRQAWRRAIDALANDARVRAAAFAEATRQARDMARVSRPFGVAVALRIERIAARAATATPSLRQSSLFDHRADRAAELRARVREKLLAHLDRRAEATRPVEPLEIGTRIRMLAAWPLAVERGPGRRERG